MTQTRDIIAECQAAGWDMGKPSASYKEALIAHPIGGILEIAKVGSPLSLDEYEQVFDFPHPVSGDKEYKWKTDADWFTLDNSAYYCAPGTTDKRLTAVTVGTCIVARVKPLFKSLSVNQGYTCEDWDEDYVKAVEDLYSRPLPTNLHLCTVGDTFLKENQELVSFSDGGAFKAHPDAYIDGSGPLCYIRDLPPKEKQTEQSTKVLQAPTPIAIPASTSSPILPFVAGAAVAVLLKPLLSLTNISKALTPPQAAKPKEIPAPSQETLETLPILDPEDLVPIPVTPAKKVEEHHFDWKSGN